MILTLLFVYAGGAELAAPLGANDPGVRGGRIALDIRP
jgi:hypothetical protein